MAEPQHVSTTRAAYNATAEAYAQWTGTEIRPEIEGPIDRALLAAFVELVGDAAELPVADLGCGPGRVAALLAASGLDVVGIDLSAAMIDVARRAHPTIRFVEGQLTELPIPNASLAGAVCWYSIIHTPPEHLRVVTSELSRVLALGAPLLVAFQAGNGEAVHRTAVLGISLSLTNYRHDPDAVVRALTSAGLPVTARAERAAEFEHESTPQAFILAKSV